MKKIFLLSLLIMLMTGCQRNYVENKVLYVGETLMELDHGQVLEQTEEVFVYKVVIDQNSIRVTVDQTGIISLYNISSELFSLEFSYNACQKEITVYKITKDGEDYMHLESQFSDLMTEYLTIHRSNQANNIIDEYCAFIKEAS